MHRAPAPSAAPFYRAPVPVRFTVEQRRLGFDADGNARLVLIVHFFDASGRPAVLLADSDVDWSAWHANVQWQTRMRYGQPAAIVSTNRDGPFGARVTVRVPSLGTVDIRDDTRTWRFPREVRTRIGPFATLIGSFPGRSRLRPITPHHVRRYSREVARGAGMWLSFSTNPLDDDYALGWNVPAMVAQAVRAHLRYVELRMAYGAYFEVDPDVRPFVDDLIDGLARRGIATIAWTVPRETSVEDVLATTRSAQYVTAHGTRVAGLAIDLERGELFMGSDTHALSTYMALVRNALGPGYPIIATVEDPYFEHLDNRTYPYAAIAQHADVLQPMAYWRMMRRVPPAPSLLRSMLVHDVQLVKTLSRSPVEVNIGGQTAPEGATGRTTRAELSASLDAVREAHAIGECFFDWNGTARNQWEALRALQALHPST